MPFPNIPSRFVITEANLDNALDVFPALAGAGFPVKNPEFATRSRESESGRVMTSARWSSPRWNFEVSYEVLRDRVALPDLQRLWAFFMSAYGAYGAWWYYDKYDNQVTAGTVGIGDGTTTDFQATRTVGAGYGYAFNEPIYGFWQTPIVYVNGTPTGAFSIQQWGVIRFSTPPANGAVITWTGKFLFPCQFVDDRINTAQMFKDLFSAEGVKFRSRKP